MQGSGTPFPKDRFDTIKDTVINNCPCVFVSLQCIEFIAQKKHTGVADGLFSVEIVHLRRLMCVPNHYCDANCL